MLTGGCKCGAVRYETDGEPASPTICYCVDCRRAAGAHAVAWFTVPTATLRFAKAPKRVRSSEAADRGFCPDCGTQIFWQDRNQPDLIDVTICSLDEPDRVPPGDHVWTGSKPGWVEIGGNLPRYVRGRKG